MQPIVHFLSSLIPTVIANASGGINSGVTAACGTNCNTTSFDAILSDVTNALVFLIGSISVLMIIIGGLRFVLANGDSKQAASARNTILYAVVGVVIAIAAYAIVHFVVTYIK